MAQEKRYWLDRPENVTKLYRGAWVIGIGLALGETLVHRHEDFAFAKWWAFYAVLPALRSCSRRRRCAAS